MNPNDPDATRTNLPDETTYSCTIEEGLIEFYSTKKSTLGTQMFEYNVAFAGFPDWPSTSQFLEIIVEEPEEVEAANLAPHFESYDNWVSPTFVGCGQPLTLEIPNLIDDNPDDEASLKKVILGKASLFANFDES